jgi:chromatin segregation and condensation protein Rec8/ScpA/Scc1 (kleisin family)/Holliday junction resolvase-like predicted endonuclease
MAATLIQIKSRMLIPVEVEAEEDEEIIEEDPRLELVEKLLEYRRFRDLSWALGRRFEIADDCFGRRVKPVIEVDPDEEDVIDISLYDLMTALRNTLKYLLDKPIHEVIGEGSSIEEKISRIEELLDASDSVAWSQLAGESRTRVEIVCCLLAILELCRMYRVRVHQHESFGEIRLFAASPGKCPRQSWNPPVWWTRKPKLPLGARGERLAARYLWLRGYTILERNLRLGKNEIDLLARKGDTVVFVEVKTRLRSDASAPEDSVGPTKQQHIRNAAVCIWQGTRDPIPTTVSMWSASLCRTRARHRSHTFLTHSGKRSRYLSELPFAEFVGHRMH